MQLKSDYINPKHKKALEELESYLSDIAGRRIEAVEVKSEEEILSWEDSSNIFRFLLNEQGKIIGLKIYGFGEKLTKIPKTLLQFKKSLFYLNLGSNQIREYVLLEKLTNLRTIWLLEVLTNANPLIITAHQASVFFSKKK